MRINKGSLREKIEFGGRRTDFPSCFTKIRAHGGAVRQSQSIDSADSIKGKVYRQITT